MPLPPPGNNVRWKDYEIDTPTFDLTPVEKPDMSPFLVHMTGKKAIESILKGEGSATTLPPEYGYLRASIPEYDQGIYNLPVVCFTESPTFALDFFRYRSFRRWQSDQRYGVGFRKSSLIQQGVRPVVYIDETVRGHFIYLYKLGIEGKTPLSNDAQINSHITAILSNLYPFLFPIFEDRPQQGFMWEREWRFPEPTGFPFPYSSIEVICCPDEEKSAIQKILGSYSSQVQFVNTWREYDEVTNFLKTQQQKLQIPIGRVAQSAGMEERLSWLTELSQQYEITINSLSSYDEFISSLSTQKSSLEKEKSTLAGELGKLKEEIGALQNEIKIKKSGG
jgi:hypothetical protein